MKFFFDESGCFRVPDERSEHAAAVVVGVVIPETEEQHVWQRFREFVGRFPTAALKKGELKGSSLDEEGRRAFAMLVSECEGMLICPAILDLTTMAGRGEASRNRIVAKLDGIVPQCRHESMRQELALLSRQVSNTSPEAALRLACWAQAIHRSIQDSIIYHSGPEFHACWSKMTFEIDPVQPKAGSREERVFTNMLPGWVTAWSRKRPFRLIEEIHTDEHPFVKNWDTATGIDLGKMIRGNVRFCPSHKSLGVQMADLAASVIRRAVVGIVSPFDLVSYGVLMSRAIGTPTHVHGLFSFADTDGKDLARRYARLVEAVANARNA
jgi:Protein of unknown function (DUF3800)